MRGVLRQFSHAAAALRRLSALPSERSLAQVVGSARKASIEIAIGTQHLAKQAQAVCEQAQQQSELAEHIAQRAAVSSNQSDEVLAASESIADTTRSQVADARNAAHELALVAERFGLISSDVRRYTQTAARLHEQARAAGDVVQLISDVARQTNLLSFNAAIEAARAGEAGRGFAVVAAEVRELAEKVRNSADTVAQQLGGIVSLSDESQHVIADINTRAADTSITVNAAAAHLNEFVKGFERIHEQAESIGSFVRRLRDSQRADRRQVAQIADLSIAVAAAMKQAAAEADVLSEKTEALQNTAAQARIGDRLDQVQAYGQRLKAQLETVMTRLVDDGVDMFDRNYRDLPNTRPQKYATAYDAKYEPLAQPLYDRALDDLGCLFYCNALDVNGFVPAHNARVSQPMTGDYERDLAFSRSKRIMTDGASQRAVTHERPVLIQTYLRDNGDRVTDVSLPLMVRGRHWGGLRLGVDSSKL